MTSAVLSLNPKTPRASRKRHLFPEQSLYREHLNLAPQNSRMPPALRAFLHQFISESRSLPKKGEKTFFYIHLSYIYYLIYSHSYSYSFPYSYLFAFLFVLLPLSVFIRISLSLFLFCVLNIPPKQK